MAGSVNEPLSSRQHLCLNRPFGDWSERLLLAELTTAARDSNDLRHAIGRTVLKPPPSNAADGCSFREHGFRGVTRGHYTHAFELRRQRGRYNRSA